MKGFNCPREAEVNKGIGSGGLDASLAMHAAGCEVCRGIVTASQYMAALSGDALQGDDGLPDAGLVYWRARLAEDVARAEKAHDVLDWVEIAPIAVAIGVAGWVAWNWFTIEGIEAFIASFLDGAWVGGVSVSTLIVVLSVVGVLGLLAGILAYPGLVGE